MARQDKGDGGEEARKAEHRKIGAQSTPFLPRDIDGVGGPEKIEFRNSRRDRHFEAGPIEGTGRKDWVLGAREGKQPRRVVKGS